MFFLKLNLYHFWENKTGKAVCSMTFQKNIFLNYPYLQGIMLNDNGFIALDFYMDLKILILKRRKLGSYFYIK